jgi:opacity protein-like surface antigen
MDTMIKRIVAAACLLLLIVAPAHAQDWFWGATWGVSFGDGTTKDYIGNESFRNFGIEGRKFVSPNTSVGLSFNWTVFNEKTNTTSQIPGGAVSGTQFRYINAFPLLVTAHKYFGDDEGTMLYVGAGTGAYAIKRRTEVGVFAVNTDSWHFGLAPEVGVIIPFGWRAKGFLMARYNLTSEAKGFEYQWWDIRIGLVSM